MSSYFFQNIIFSNLDCDSVAYEIIVFPVPTVRLESSSGHRIANCNNRHGLISADFWGELT